MSVAERVGRGAWEAAKIDEYMRSVLFACAIQAEKKRLWGIIEVMKEKNQAVGKLSIPMRAISNSAWSIRIGANRASFADPDNYWTIAHELGLTFGKHYFDLIVSSLGGEPYTLFGVTSSLIVSNKFSQTAPKISGPGDAGVTMGLAQHIMEALPGEWLITPEPVISQ